MFFSNLKHVKVFFYSKQQMDDKISSLDVSVNVKLGLIFDFDLDIDSSVATSYKRHKEDSKLTQRVILVIKKRGGVSEITPKDIEVIQKRKSDEFMTPINSHATHIVSQIEYGSHLNIELIYTGSSLSSLEKYFITQNVSKINLIHINPYNPKLSTLTARIKLFCHVSIKLFE